VKLPRYTAETPPPRETGLVRAQDIGALTRTGETAIWRGVSRVGEAMQKVAGLGFDAYQRRRMFDDEIQLGRATQRDQGIVADKLYEIERTDFKMDMPLPDDPDYEKTLVALTVQKRDELIKGTMRDIDELVAKIPQGFSSRKTAERYKLHWVETRARAERKIIHAYDRKFDSFQRDAMTKLSEDAARNGSLEIANYYIDLMDKYELITPELASIKRVQVEKMTAEATLDFAKGLIETEVRQIAVAEGWESSYRHILDPKNQQEWSKTYSISLAEVKKITLDIKTMLTGEQTLAKIEAKRQDDEISGTFMKLLINKLDPTKEQLTFDTITDSELSLDMKEEWFTKLRVFDNYSEGELEDAFRDQGAVLADTYERIEDNTITDKEIRDTVGKGLSPTTAEAMIEDREIWRQHWYKETEQLFKRILGWSPELGFADDMSMVFYEKALREWREQVKEQDAKGEEIIEIGRTVVRPYFIEHLKATMTIEDIPRMVELALGEPEEIEEEPLPVVPETEEPELYEIGETRLDGEGQSWEYIGDDKWRKK